MLKLVGKLRRFAMRISPTKLAGRITFRTFDRRLRRDFPIDSTVARTCGNYVIDGSLVRSDDVVYSCGVGTSIDFDESIHRQFGCSVYMFDPTPLAVKYIQGLGDRPYRRLLQWGVWTRDIAKQFYFKSDESDDPRNVSITNLHGSHNFLEFQCYALTTIMEKLGHDHLDVLKMDIEGAAFPVLLHLMRETNVRPRQIVVEFEKGLGSTRSFNHRVRQLLDELQREGYRVHYLPREGVFRHVSYEFLFVRDTSQDATTGHPLAA